MSNQYTLYRKKIAFRLSVNDGFVGFEAANVIPETMNDENPRYSWDSKIILSLTVDEIGKLIGLFSGMTNNVSFFHTSSKGSKTFKATKAENGNILATLDHTDGSGNKSVVSGISIMPENAIVFIELLKSGIFSLTQYSRGSNAGQ